MAETTEKQTQEKLPEYMRPLFWEFRFGWLRWPKHKSTIVDRILVRGGTAEIRWLLDRIGYDGVRDHLHNTGGRTLSLRQLRYWQHILDVPKHIVDEWMAFPGRQIWDNRTRVA